MEYDKRVTVRGGTGSVLTDVEVLHLAQALHYQIHKTTDEADKQKLWHKLFALMGITKASSFDRADYLVQELFCRSKRLIEILLHNHVEGKMVWLEDSKTMGTIVGHTKDFRVKVEMKDGSQKTIVPDQIK